MTSAPRDFGEERAAAKARTAQANVERAGGGATIKGET